MTLRKVVEWLDLEVLTGAEGLEREVTGGYASDLLSDVMAHGKAGNLWVTLQTHVNVIAVATLKELAAIVLVNGRVPEAETLARAQQEKVPVLSSRLPAFELIGRLHRMGLTGGG